MDIPWTLLPCACRGWWERGLRSAPVPGPQPPCGPASQHLLKQLTGQARPRGWGQSLTHTFPSSPPGPPNSRGPLGLPDGVCRECARGQKWHLSLIRGFYVTTTAILEPGAWRAAEPRCCLLWPSTAVVGAERRSHGSRGPDFSTAWRPRPKVLTGTALLMGLPWKGGDHRGFWGV